MNKAVTGIEGLDVMTAGGLPRGRITLLQGPAGSGKTVLALQTLVNASGKLGEPGIFVAFEESPERIRNNAASFGWDLPAPENEQLLLINAQPDPELVVAGDMDLGGLLAVLDGQVKAMGARWIAFDAIDVFLHLLSDPDALRREIYRLNTWLNDRQLTVIVTAKSLKSADTPLLRDIAELIKFMVDCVIVLDHEHVNGFSHRNLQIVKYRGSAFDESLVPMLITDLGIQVAAMRTVKDSAELLDDVRLSSGVAQLDEMLGDGYFRASSILVTGAPGTAKTSLAGAFAASACARKEPVLFVSFDSKPHELLRNLKSIGLSLAPFVDSGLLKILPMRAIAASAEFQLVHIRSAARKQGARHLVVDPVSAFSKSSIKDSSQSVVVRLIDWAKSEGITLFCTSLLDRHTGNDEATEMHISTIADTWLQLSYQINAGERNRGVSIIKSRGSRHSNQVRELILADNGIRLTEVYTAGGEVLMGSLRLQKEQENRLRIDQTERVAERIRRQAELETELLESRLATLQKELLAKRLEIENQLAENRDLQQRHQVEQAEVLKARESGYETVGPASSEGTSGE